jgi:hypothetical protein
MTRAQQTFVNRHDEPIYISIEPTPDCYELEPGESLTLIFKVPESGDALNLWVGGGREMAIWPMADEEPEVLINGKSAEGRSWKFTHA